MEKALHIAAFLEAENFMGSNGRNDSCKRIHNIVYRALAGISRSVDSETMYHSKNYCCTKLKTVTPVTHTHKHKCARARTEANIRIYVALKNVKKLQTK
jgi:hypothetical protein